MKAFLENTVGRGVTTNRTEDTAENHTATRACDLARGLVRARVREEGARAEGAEKRRRTRATVTSAGSRVRRMRIDQTDRSTFGSVTDPELPAAVS